MSDEKKKNPFVKWTEKHAEIWKFIKFMIAGGGSSVVELIVHMVLLTAVFKSLTEVPITNPTLNMIGIQSKGYLFAYLISTTIGYLIAFILDDKIKTEEDVAKYLGLSVLGEIPNSKNAKKNSLYFAPCAKLRGKITKRKGMP